MGLLMPIDRPSAATNAVSDMPSPPPIKAPNPLYGILLYAGGCSLWRLETTCNFFILLLVLYFGTAGQAGDEKRSGSCTRACQALLIAHEPRTSTNTSYTNTRRCTNTANRTLRNLSPSYSYVLPTKTRRILKQAR